MSIVLTRPSRSYTPGDLPGMAKAVRCLLSLGKIGDARGMCVLKRKWDLSS